MDGRDALFALLRAGLHGKTPSELTGQIDWSVVAPLAQKHTVLGIVIEGVKLLPDGQRPSPRSQDRMVAYARGLIKTSNALDHLVVKMTEHLKSHGISSVLLKGQGVARYYPSSHLRHVGDIDLYVGRQYFASAYEACREFMPADAPARPPRRGQHFSFHINGVSIEIHRYATRAYSPKANRRMQAWIADQLERSPRRRSYSVGGVDIALPPLEFDAIYVFYHAWRHYCFEGIGLRHLCDWAVIMSHHGDKLDKDRLVGLIRSFGMVGPWRIMACIIVDKLGVPASSVPLYDPAYAGRAAVVLDDILASGNFGFYASDTAERYTPPSTLSAAWRRMKKITRQFVTLLPIVPAEACALLISRSLCGTRDFLTRILSGNH